MGNIYGGNPSSASLVLLFNNNASGADVTPLEVEILDNDGAYILDNDGAYIIDNA